MGLKPKRNLIIENYMIEPYQTIAPQFRSRKSFLSFAKKVRDIQVARRDTENSAEIIDRFLLADSNAQDYFISALNEFENSSFAELFFLTGRCLKDNSWDLRAYRSSLARLCLSYQLLFFNKEKNRIVFSSTNPTRVVNPISIPTTFGNMVGLMAVFGNKDIFVNTARFCLDLFDRGLAGGDATPLTQLFILRLAERHLGGAERNWLADPYPWAVDPCEKEPLFKALMQHWQDENMDILEPLLLQLLNRHTFQASRNNKDGAKDFDGHTEQFPLELFFIYRLRQWHGLSLPSLTHRLIEPPFHELPPELEQFVFDDRSKQFMNMTRKVFPELDPLVKGARIREWKMLL